MADKRENIVPPDNGANEGHLDPLSRLLQKRLGDDSCSLPDDEESRRKLPVLWAFLTRRAVDGKVAKQPASISIRLGLGSWLVSITDPSLEVSLTASSPVLADCIEQLEAAARDPLAAWSPWKRSKGKFERVNTSTPSREEAPNPYLQ